MCLLPKQMPRFYSQRSVAKCSGPLLKMITGNVFRDVTILFRYCGPKYQCQHCSRRDGITLPLPERTLELEGRIVFCL